MICRLIAPKWLTGKKTLEGDFTEEEILKYNAEGYNVYYWPNGPKSYTQGKNISGADITDFRTVFVDFDLKSNIYANKEAFLESLADRGIEPSRVVDSGCGIHCYFYVADLDAKSYLYIARRMMRYLKTDDAVGTIAQLMRLPGTMNTKNKDSFVPCEIIYESDKVYTCEELDKMLPPISPEDEQHCIQHYEKTYNLTPVTEISEVLPKKFGKLLRKNHEAKEIWSGNTTDRSKSDYRLAHIMLANEFTRDEALSVLVNSAKAMSRAPVHRANYAQNIVDKVWTHETVEGLDLSESVESILRRGDDTVKGTPFRCHKRIDNTQRGFRLGDVIGLVGGSGIGKTAFGLNMFKWFLEENPDYHHFFVSLEQPKNEVADRWATMCGGSHVLNGKVHVLSNYDDEGNFRALGLDEIQEYIERWQKVTSNKVGCVIIDHIGALKKKGSDDEKQDLATICHSMKAFAIQTKTLLVMQSQTSREKAGIGDLELNKDAAYGTSTFEWYCDYLITLWQPLKRCHSEETCPTVTAFKYCKIRHKRPKKDIIKEDIPYYFYFDSDRELLRDMTEDEETAFKFFLPKATNKRKADRKTDLVEYKSVPYNEGTNERPQKMH